MDGPEHKVTCDPLVVVQFHSVHKIVELGLIVFGGN